VKTAESRLAGWVRARTYYGVLYSRDTVARASASRYSYAGQLLTTRRERRRAGGDPTNHFTPTCLPRRDPTQLLLPCVRAPAIMLPPLLGRRRPVQLVACLALGGVATTTTSSSGHDGKATCKFEKQIDYGSGSQHQPDGWPQKGITQQECCEACSADESCYAGVMALAKEGDTTGDCWHKDKVDMAKPGKPCCGKHSMGCTLEERDNGEEVNGGVPLSPVVFVLMVLGGAGALYCGGGFAVGLRRGGEQRGRHPHQHLWRAWAVDGWAAVSGGGRVGAAATGRATARGGGVPTEAAGRRSERSTGARADRSTGARGSGKKKSKGKKEGKSKRKGGSRDLEAALSAPHSAPPAPAPAPPMEWQPTRTGHLAVGARETGVKVVM
jgi:hypothetical protein